MRLPSILRRAILIIAMTLGSGLLPAAPALATTSNQAEEFVQTNIRKGLDILNNKQISTGQRRSEFESFLIGLTDMKRIANFTLGQYRRSASPAELSDFQAAFQNYAVAVYQSYFDKYAGQS